MPNSGDYEGALDLLKEAIEAILVAEASAREQPNAEGGGADRVKALRRTAGEYLELAEDYKRRAIAAPLVPVEPVGPIEPIYPGLPVAPAMPAAVAAPSAPPSAPAFPGGYAPEQHHPGGGMGGDGMGMNLPVALMRSFSLTRKRSFTSIFLHLRVDITLPASMLRCSIAGCKVLSSRHYALPGTSMRLLLHPRQCG